MAQTEATATTTTRTVYVRRRLDPPVSGTELAREIDDAVIRLAENLEVVSVALTAINGAAVEAAGGHTSGVLVTAVLRERE